MPAQAPFATPNSFDTKLSPIEELMFRGWVQKNDVPFDANASGPTDYDMRGYYRGMVNGNPMARASEINQNDGRPHFTDYYKTPLHRSFSSESQWAGPDAPQWVNDTQLAATNGRVVYDEGQSAIARLLAGMK